MNTTKRLILIIALGVLGFKLIGDIIKIFQGYTYTWYGVITALGCLLLIRIVLDMLED